MSRQVTVTVIISAKGEKKILWATRAVIEGDWRGREQVAVNLERKRVIIHLEKGGESVCCSAGSTKLSQYQQEDRTA